MDKLRSAVLQFLSRSQQPKTVEQIADEMGQHPDTIRAVVEHEWFSMDDLVVSIKPGSELVGKN